MTQGKELMVGAVIIAAILVVAGGTLWLQGTNFGRTVTYVEVLVRDVGQLTEGNAVKFRGVQIGRVDGIAVEPDGEAVRVGMELEGEVDLSGDAVVVIAPESLFGDWQAEIVTRSRFPRYDYYDVPPSEERGDTTVLGGYALPDLTRLTAAADAISENVEALTDRFDRAFNEETAENLQITVSNLQEISEDMRRLVSTSAATLDDVRGDVQSTATEISQAAASARETLEEIDQILHRGEVDSILEGVTAATRDIRTIASNVSETTEGFDQTMARMDSTFARIDRLTGMVEQGEGSLGRLLADSTLALRAEQVLDQLDSLLADVQANPRRYVRLSIF